MCGVRPGGGGVVDGVDLSRETVIAGRVRRGDQPVAGAYVRLLDAKGEFTAEVVTDEAGGFRFFAAPGEWTLRALAPGAAGQTTVAADTSVDTEISLPA